MRLGYNHPLYLLPFDHRHSFVKGMFHASPPLTIDQRQAVIDSKRVIYDGFRQAIACGLPSVSAGILVDEEFGADIMRNATSNALPEAHRYDLKLAEIAEVWRRGSVVSSWLLDLAALALTADPQLEQFVGKVADSGEGRWTVQAAIDEDVPADVLTTALYVRFRSRRDHTFAEKLLSALRAQFGGHVEPPR